MTTKAYQVECEWCGAKPGEPCKDLNDQPYIGGQVHVGRQRLWDEQEVNRLIANRPELLPPKPRSAKPRRCTR